MSSRPYSSSRSSSARFAGALMTAVALAACGDDDRGPLVLRERPELRAELTAARTNLVQDDTVTVIPRLVRVPSGDSLPQTVTFRSSAPTVASVSNAGLVRALLPGTAAIISSVRVNDSTYSDTVTITVGNANAVAAVVASDETVFAGSTTTLRNTLTNAAGTVLPASRARTFTSLDTSLATVSAGGVITGRVAGTLNVIVASEGRVDTAVVTVRNRPVVAVGITPDPGIVRVGSTITLTAATTASTGAVLTGRSVVFTSDNPAIARVDPNTGVVTGVAAGGPVTIRATSEGVTGLATVVVNP